jgi:hypothetical protein
MGMGVPQDVRRLDPKIPMLERMPKQGPVTSGPTTATGKVTSSGDGIFSKARAAMKTPNFKKGALVAAGVLAAGSVVQSRRREGTSSGRQSMYRH